MRWDWESAMGWGGKGSRKDEEERGTAPEATEGHWFVLGGGRNEVRMSKGGKRQAGSAEDWFCLRPPCRYHFRNPRASSFPICISLWLTALSISKICSFTPPPCLPNWSQAQRFPKTVSHLSPLAGGTKGAPGQTCCWPGLPTLVYVVFWHVGLSTKALGNSLSKWVG